MTMDSFLNNEYVTKPSDSQNILKDKVSIIIMFVHYLCPYSFKEPMFISYNKV